MKKRINSLKNFYDNRKNKENQILDNNVKLERFVTLHTLNKYIKKDMKVIEIGAGIRSYSIDLLNLTNDVTAVDLFNNNLQNLKDKNKLIKTVRADILNLSCFKDNTFDVVFVNGPMSHLFSEKERLIAIKESVRVCKKGGYIFYNYLSNTSVLIRYGLIKNNLSKCKSKFTKNYSFNNIDEDIYSTYFIADFNNMFKNLNVNHIVDISTDGLFEVLKEYTNKLGEEDFEIVKEWQLGVCERKDMQGLATHILTIYQKS